MYEKKKDGEIKPILKRDIVNVEKKETSTGNYILKLEGLVTQVQKEIEKLPPGDIPVKILNESADVHTFGKRTFLVFVEKSKNPGEKALLVDAVGLEELSRKIKDIYDKYRLVDVISQPVNKRIQSKRIYLAIFVG